MYTSCAPCLCSLSRDTAVILPVSVTSVITPEYPSWKRIALMYGILSNAALAASPSSQGTYLYEKTCQRKFPYDNTWSESFCFSTSLAKAYSQLFMIFCSVICCSSYSTSITTSSGRLKILGILVVSLASPRLTIMVIFSISYLPPAYFGKIP